MFSLRSVPRLHRSCSFAGFSGSSLPYDKKKGDVTLTTAKTPPRNVTGPLSQPGPVGGRRSFFLPISTFPCTDSVKYFSKLIFCTSVRRLCTFPSLRSPLTRVAPGMGDCGARGRWGRGRGHRIPPLLLRNNGVKPPPAPSCAREGTYTRQRRQPAALRGRSRCSLSYLLTSLQKNAKKTPKMEKKGKRQKKRKKPQAKLVVCGVFLLRGPAARSRRPPGGSGGEGEAVWGGKG